MIRKINTETHENFFLVIPPGFESLASLELGATLPHEITKGGITLLASLEVGLALNHRLSIPTRILLRIAEFKCRDLPKLYNQGCKISWRHYLWNEDFTIHATASQSRVIHTGRIEETLRSSIKTALKAQPFSLKFQNLEVEPPHLYARIENDVCTISLDTSYPALYKRGLGKDAHPASLRENLASGCYQFLISKMDPSTTSFDLIDPMCGSGTFLTEATQIHQVRPFAYQNTPLMKFHPLKWNAKELQPLHQISAYGYDLNEEYIKKNQELFPSIHWQTRDLTAPLSQVNELNEAQEKTKYTVIISNPPYNRRIKMDINHSLAANLMAELYQPDLMGLVLPKDSANNVKIKGMTHIDSLPFRNGGFACEFRVWRNDFN